LSGGTVVSAPYLTPAQNEDVRGSDGDG